MSKVIGTIKIVSNKVESQKDSQTFGIILDTSNNFTNEFSAEILDLSLFLDPSNSTKTLPVKKDNGMIVYVLQSQIQSTIISGTEEEVEGVTEQWVTDYVQEYVDEKLEELENSGEVLKLDGTTPMKGDLDLGGKKLKEVSTILGTEAWYDLPISSDMVNGEVQINMDTWLSWYGDTSITTVIKYRDRIKVLGNYYSVNGITSDGILNVSGSLNLTQSELQNQITSYDSNDNGGIWVRGDLFLSNEFRVSGLLDPINENDASTKKYVDESIQGLTLTGTVKDIWTFNPDGSVKIGPVTPELLSDFDTESPYENGILVYATDPETNIRKLGWINVVFEPVPNASPMYTAGQLGSGGGILKTEDPIENNDSVNKRFLVDQLTPKLTATKLSAHPSLVAGESTFEELRTNYISLIDKLRAAGIILE